MWAKLDDRFLLNSKARAAGLQGRALYIAGLLHCAGSLTDGFIRAADVPLLAAMAEVAPDTDLLVTVGLWETVEGGYRVHDWHEYNPSAEKVREERRRNAERQADWRDRHRTDDGTFSVSNAVTDAVTNARPVPVPVPVPDPVLVPYLPTYRAGRENDPITLWDDAVHGAPRKWRQQLNALGIRAIERGRADMLPAAVSYVAARDLTTPYPYLIKVVEGCLASGEEPGGKLPEKIRAAAGARGPQRGAFAGKWAQNTLR